MTRSTMIILPLALLAAGVAACPDARPRFARDAEFIFSGTTVLPRAATIDADDVSNLAIVRVDTILVGAPVFARLTGQPVTVQLRDPGRAREGERRVYFTKGWYYGDGIGVIEVGSVTAPAGPGMQTMQSDIERFRQEQSDRDLAERLRSAELVVMGKVAAIRPSDIPRGATEHDPEWYEADIQVTAVLKGSDTTHTVRILFPASRDVMWYDAPKFEKGAEGMWLLRPLAIAGRRLAHLTAPQRGDFRPTAEEPRIRRLLQQK